MIATAAMGAGSVIAAAILSMGCVTLLWSGLEKLRNRHPLEITLAGIGLGASFARRLAVVVPLVELATVGTVVGAPSSAPVSAGLIAGLGIAFAAMGMWTLATKRDVACACFGPSGGRLGWTQVAALPVWVVAAWCATQVPQASPYDRLRLAVALVIAMVCVRGVPALRSARLARSDRHALAGG